jgi:hypothetical protein
MDKDNEAPKPTCFVIQAFDGGKYDRRYHETIKPALVKAGVEPQRADDILGLNPVIEKIERAIEAAAICVAEVSEDNPNVWLELGYALALNRPAVILCDKAIRPRLPFDIQHRPVILYRTDSKSGYEDAEREIIRLVKNQLSTEQRITSSLTLKPGSEAPADLEKYEVSVLTLAFAFWPTPHGSISHWDLEQKLKAEGFNDVALALGIAGLIRRGLILERIVEEGSGYDAHDVKHYQVTPEGISWIESHKDILTLTAPKFRRTPAKVKTGFEDMDDDIPF